jgi:hypothetical protein
MPGGDCSEIAVFPPVDVICIDGPPGVAGCGTPCSEERCEVGHTECQDTGLFACMPFGSCPYSHWMAPCADRESCEVWQKSTLVLDHEWVVLTERAGSNMGADYGDSYRFTGEGCGAAAGPEAIFSFRLDEGQTVRLYETGEVDVRIRVVEACDPMGGCLLDADLDDDESEGVTFTSPEELGTYHVIFEAVEGAPSPADYSFHMEPL